MTPETERKRAIDLASRVPAFLRRRLQLVPERAREGQASARQVREAMAACAASTRALRSVKRRLAPRRQKGVA